MNDNLVTSTTTATNNNNTRNASIDVITIIDDEEYDANDDEIECLDDHIIVNNCNNDNDIEIIEVKVKNENSIDSGGDKANITKLNGDSSAHQTTSADDVKPSTSSANTDTNTNSTTIESEAMDETEPIAGTSNPIDVSLVKIELKQKYLPDVNDADLYDNYINMCRQRMNAINTVEGHNQTATDEEISKFSKLVDKLKKDKPKFVQSSQYLMLLRVFASDITNEKDDNRVIRYHNDLLIELNRVSKKVKRTNGERRMSKAALKKKIDKLTNQLKKLQRIITEAENEVLDYDMMDTASKYTDLPRLHKKQLQIWKKREELLKRSTKTGRYLFKKFHYNNGSIPDELRQSAEQYFNKFLKKLENWNRSGYKDDTLTFIDIHVAMTKVIDEKNIALRDKDAIIKQIFIDLRNELRERSSMETEDDLESLVTLEDLRPETIANENDPQIEIELSVNKNVFTRKLNELLVKFASKDRERNGDNLLNGVNGEKEWEKPLLDNEDYDLIDVKEEDLVNEDEESETELLNEIEEEMDVSETTEQNQQSSQISAADNNESTDKNA